MVMRIDVERIHFNGQLRCQSITITKNGINANVKGKKNELRKLCFSQAAYLYFQMLQNLLLAISTIETRPLKMQPEINT